MYFSDSNNTFVGHKIEIMSNDSASETTSTNATFVDSTANVSGVDWMVELNKHQNNYLFWDNTKEIRIFLLFLRRTTQ